MLAQWVPLHAVSCSNLIETGGSAESREIPLRVTQTGERRLFILFLPFFFLFLTFGSWILHLNNRISNTHNNTDTLGNVGGKSWRLVLHLVAGGFH